MMISTLLMSLIFWSSLSAMFVVWVFYPLGLWLAVKLVSRSDIKRAQVGREITILIAARNEERNLQSRLENLLEVGSNDFALNVLVALNDTSDRSREVIDTFSHSHPGLSVRWFDVQGKGKAIAHNEAMQRISTQFVLFTDADTIFSGGFIDRIGHAFDDEEVGYASGALSWRGKDTPQGANNFPLYWRFEIMLRSLETTLGICAVGTGACSAMRSALFVPLHPTSDADCSTPLDVVQQGYRCIQVLDARATDFVADTVGGEFKGRVRMTSKNLINTLRSWKWKENVVALPWITVGLLLHKIGRWFTPIFMTGILISGCGLWSIGAAGVVVKLVTSIGIAGCVAAAIGFFKPSLPILGALGSFAMANIAFALGILHACSGRVPTQFDKIK